MRKPGYLWWPFLLLTSLLPFVSRAYADDLPVGVVTRLEASEGPGVAADGHPVSNVTVAFNPPAPDGIWSGIEIYAVSSDAPQLIAAGAASPLGFTLDSTGQEIRLYAVSVTRDGRRSPLAASPSVSLLLDGLVSPPVPVSQLTAQTAGNGVRLWWPENLENDIARYEIAALPATASPSAGERDNLPVIATVAAAGANATQKANWEDHPSSDQQGRTYYVRAVNTSGQVSDWTAVTPAADPAVSNLAPDGTTDSGVPNWNVYHGLGVSVPGNGNVTFLISWTDRWTLDVRLPLNNAGITNLWIKVYYSGGDGQGSRTFRFADNGSRVFSLDGTRTFTIELPNATLLGEEHWFENYFGQGAHQAATYAVPRFTGDLTVAPAASSGTVPEGPALTATDSVAPDAPSDPPAPPVRQRYQE